LFKQALVDGVANPVMVSRRRQEKIAIGSEGG